MPNVELTEPRCRSRRHLAAMKRGARRWIVAAILGCAAVASCSDKRPEPLSESGATASSRIPTTVPRPSVETDGLILGRNENTELLAFDDGAIAVVDSAALQDQGERRQLTLWIGNAEQLVPHPLDGPPLIWTDAYVDDDAVVVAGLECPDFVAEEPEEPSYEDLCGPQRGRSVAYRFERSDGTWRLLNDAMPATENGYFSTAGAGRWALVIEYRNAGNRPYRLDSRTGDLTRLRGPTAGQRCTTRHGVIIVADISDSVKVFQDGRYRMVAIPSPPKPVGFERVWGCLPGVGGYFRAEDGQTLEVVTTNDDGMPMWHTIPAPPAGTLEGEGPSLTAWAGVEGDRIKALVFDGAEWRILGISKGFVIRAAFRDERLVYQYSTGDETALGVM
jgi:hypothetical protein